MSFWGRINNNILKLGSRNLKLCVWNGSTRIGDHISFDSKLKFSTDHYHHIVLEQYEARNIYGEWYVTKNFMARVLYQTYFIRNLKLWIYVLVIFHSAGLEFHEGNAKWNDSLLHPIQVIALMIVRCHKMKLNMKKKLSFCQDIA